MERECNRPGGRKSKKLALGIIFVFLGIVWLADNFGILPGAVNDVIFSWQMLLIGIGVLNLFGRNSYMAGAIMILIGVFFLIPEIFPFNFSFTKLFWPVILIGIGSLIILRRGFHRNFHKHHYANVTEGQGNTIEEVNIFGGSKQHIVSQEFRGGKITSIFGGSEIDLSNAKLADGVHVLDMVCIFGGSSIIVPSDWHIRAEMVSILGGFADKRYSIPNPISREKELIIKGIAIFGGGEIKSF